MNIKHEGSFGPEVDEVARNAAIVGADIYLRILNQAKTSPASQAPTTETSPPPFTSPTVTNDQVPEQADEHSVSKQSKPALQKGFESDKTFLHRSDASDRKTNNGLFGSPRDTTGDDFARFLEEDGIDFRVPSSVPEVGGQESTLPQEQEVTTPSKAKSYRLSKLGGSLLKVLLPNFSTNRRTAWLKTGTYVAAITAGLTYAITGGNLPSIIESKPPVAANALDPAVDELNPLPSVKSEVVPAYLFTQDVLTGFNNPSFPNQKPPASLLVTADGKVAALFQAKVKDLAKDPSGMTENVVTARLDTDANGQPLKISLRQAIEVSLISAGDSKIEPYTIEKTGENQFVLTIDRSRFGADANTVFDYGNINPNVPDKFNKLELVGTPLTPGLQPDGVTTITVEEAESVNNSLVGVNKDVFDDGSFLQLQLLAMRAFEEGKLSAGPEQLSEVFDSIITINAEAVATQHQFVVQVKFKEDSVYDMKIADRTVNKDPEIYKSTAELSGSYPVTLMDGGTKVVVERTYEK